MKTNESTVELLAIWNAMVNILRYYISFIEQHTLKDIFTAWRHHGDKSL